MPEMMIHDLAASAQSLSALRKLDLFLDCLPDCKSALAVIQAYIRVLCPGLL
jgi:hypothetical protein